MLLIELWLLPPGYTLGAEGNVIPLPPGAVMRLGQGWVNAVKYSPDGKYLAVATSIGIELRDVETLKLVRFFQGHTDDVDSVAFSPDGRTLASGSELWFGVWDNTVKLWDVSTGKLIRTLTGHTDYVRSVAFSPNGQMLASGSWDGTVLIWDMSALGLPQGKGQ